MITIAIITITILAITAIIINNYYNDNNNMNMDD